MIQKERENLFALLRVYHEGPLMNESSNTEISAFNGELETMKDKIVSMVLGLVRGDEEFTDWSPALKAFALEIKAQSIHTEKETKERGVLTEKVDQLLAVVTLAGRSI